MFVPRFPVLLWNFGECDGSVLSVVLSCSTGVLTEKVYSRWMLSNWDEFGGNVEAESHCGPLRMGSEKQMRPRKDSRPHNWKLDRVHESPEQEERCGSTFGLLGCPGRKALGTWISRGVTC